MYIHTYDTAESLFENKRIRAFSVELLSLRAPSPSSFAVSTGFSSWNWPLHVTRCAPLWFSLASASSPAQIACCDKKRAHHHRHETAFLCICHYYCMGRWRAESARRTKPETKRKGCNRRRMMQRNTTKAPSDTINYSLHSN